jgi:hypothetical protein
LYLVGPSNRVIYRFREAYVGIREGCGYD